MASASSRMKRCSFSASASSPTQQQRKQKDLSCHCQRSRQQSNKYAYMSKDEIVNLCEPLERPRARRVVDALRKYLIQVSESQGFDFDVYPGHFDGVTSVMPIEHSNYGQQSRVIFLHDNPNYIAQSVIARYNLKNKETEYKVENVEKMYLTGDGTCCAFTFYITFRVRDVKNEAEAVTMKTFQASVMMKAGSIVRIFKCRPKPDCCSS